MTTKTIHDNRITDLLGTRPAARLLLEVPQPSPPVPNAVLTYYVESYRDGAGHEHQALYLALEDYRQLGSRWSEIRALATVYSDFEPDEIAQQWTATFDDRQGAWGAWR